MLGAWLDTETSVRTPYGAVHFLSALPLRDVQPKGCHGGASGRQGTVHLLCGGHRVIDDGGAEGQKDMREGGIREGKFLDVHNLGSAGPVLARGNLVVDSSHGWGEVGGVDLDAIRRRRGKDALGDRTQAAG